MTTGWNANKTTILLLILSCWLTVAAAAAQPATADKAAKTIYDYSLVDFHKKEVPLSLFKGKVLLIVNLASQSIFRDQIALLDELQKAYRKDGLVIIGVPSNDFGAQEPGSDEDIQKIYRDDYQVTFPVFARASVRGKDQTALYEFLTGATNSATKGDVHWNYTKFMVDRTGKVIARFEPRLAPNSPELKSTLEDVLAGKFKPERKDAAEEKKNTDSREGDRR